MPFKKSARSKTSTRSKKSAGSKTSTDFASRIGAGAILMVVVGGIAAVMLMAPRESSESADIATADVQSQGVASQPPKAPEMTRVRPKTLAAGVAPASKPAAPMTPSVTAAAPVTLAGCLERDDATFRLKDTLGADAPKSRSWKSGFLKKSSASITIVDAPTRLNLANHVGQRVSVTGMLEDGQMRVRSMRRVAASCK
jgi:type IV secretory pathway VirB10-like protein